MSVLRMTRTKPMTKVEKQRPETPEKKEQQKPEFDKVYLLAVEVSREVKKNF